MSFDLQVGLRLDAEVHVALYGVGLVEGEQVPAYSTDEAIALQALQRQYGSLELRWGRRRGGPTLDVLADGRLLFRGLWGRTRALAACSAVIHLAAHRALRRDVASMETGFYWFRPQSGVFFFPMLTRTEGGAVSGTLFSFAKSEPIPVFVHRLGHALEVTGIGSPLEWPDDEGGPMTVPAEVLPGDYGPRIAPPRNWHPDHRPEESVEFPGQSCAVYEWDDDGR